MYEAEVERLQEMIDESGFSKRGWNLSSVL